MPDSVGELFAPDHGVLVCVWFVFKIICDSRGFCGRRIPFSCITLAFQADTPILRAHFTLPSLTDEDIDLESGVRIDVDHSEAAEGALDGCPPSRSEWKTRRFTC